MTQRFSYSYVSPPPKRRHLSVGGRTKRGSVCTSCRRNAICPVHPEDCRPPAHPLSREHRKTAVADARITTPDVYVQVWVYNIHAGMLCAFEKTRENVRFREKNSWKPIYYTAGRVIRRRHGENKRLKSIYVYYKGRYNNIYFMYKM